MFCSFYHNGTNAHRSEGFSAKEHFRTLNVQGQPSLCSPEAPLAVSPDPSHHGSLLEQMMARGQASWRLGPLEAAWVPQDQAPSASSASPTPGCAALPAPSKAAHKPVASYFHQDSCQGRAWMPIVLTGKVEAQRGQKPARGHMAPHQGWDPQPGGAPSTLSLPKVGLPGKQGSSTGNPRAQPA